MRNHIGSDFSVTVPREEVLTKLRQHLKSHRENYLKAVDAYYIQAAKVLKENLDSLEKRPTKGLAVMLTFPVNYEDSYETAIEMLEMEVNDTIELSRDLFVKFVKNEWEWANMFATSTMSYLAK